MRTILLTLLFLSFTISSSFAETIVLPTLTPQTTPTIVQKTPQVTIPMISQYMLLGTASPAAMKCFQDGGYLRGTRGVSGPVAYCIFNKPFQIIEEWAYFRGEIARTK